MFSLNLIVGFFDFQYLWNETTSMLERYQRKIESKSTTVYQVYLFVVSHVFRLV